MREIKFRVWDKELNEYEIPSVYNAIIFPAITENEDIVIEQYIGLKDKNGKEIYENDLIKNEYGKIMQVTFNHGSFIIGKYYVGTIGAGKIIEVVGNIHENEDLLEVSE